MPFTDEFRRRLLKRLTHLYGGDAPDCCRRIEELTGRYDLPKDPRNLQDSGDLWDERDVVLITYGDQIRRPDRHCRTDLPPLQALKSFLEDHRLSELINTVHILPFCPYSSDDGFSVIDYRQVDPQLGTWDDVADLGRHCSLMFDLVLNHCSQQSEWFQQYLAGRQPYDKYFVEADPTADLSGVTRPRSLPLLTPFEAGPASPDDKPASPDRRGTRHVWTTFSADQVDLNFANPEVLVEMLDVLLFYVARGARIVRLDAIAYLWKEIGTTCIHLPQTHTVVKLMRDLLDELAPGTILLTETSVPHAENVSYFGEGDEAQMVYQFSLAPLLLDAFLAGDAGPLTAWLASLEQTRPGTTFFNFTASHDGVGVRPLEGLVSDERLARLVDAVRERGGLVNTRRNPDGSDSPYELNITYFSALSLRSSTRGTGEEGRGDAGTRGRGEEVLFAASPLRRVSPSPGLHARRFLASQAVMLALRGIPGVYFHSLIGTPNYSEGVEQTGRSRTINRRKFTDDELQQILDDEHSAQRLVFDGYRRLLAVRIDQPAFHPEADQQVVDLGNPALIAFRRTSLDGRQTILVLANVSGQTVSVDLSPMDDFHAATDLISGTPVAENNFQLPPFAAAWLSAASDG